MAEKNRVEVRIAGKDYALLGSASDEYIQKIALYVDKRMNEIMKSNHTLSTSMVAVLTALNIADDYFKSLENSEDLEKELKKVQEQLNELKDEKKNLSRENAALSEEISNLRIELARREAELEELHNSLDILTRP